MAAYISFQPLDYFNTKLWLGVGGGSGTGQTISGVGFQGDLTWIKSYSGANNHTITDSVRGYNSQLCSAASAAQTTYTDALLSWNSDGYALGVDTASGVVNNVGVDYAGWNWKAGTTTGLSGGTITPSSYSINTTSGFGMYKYTGTGSAGTIAHGLGVAPELVIVKCIDADGAWTVWNKGMTGGDYYMVMNTTAGQSQNANVFAATPTDTVISLGNAGGVNGSPNLFIAYCFAPKKGYSKFGTYNGNGNVDGTFVYTGFRPAWIMLKISNTTGAWYVFDYKREGYNVDNDALLANDNGSESVTDYIDIVSNGFKLRSTLGVINGSANPIAYAAFAEFPLVSSNSKAGTAR